MKIPTVFKNLNWLDGVLMVVFTALVSIIVQSFFPPQGWAIGIVAALFLLYLAKSRRDKLKQAQERDQDQ